MLLYGAYVRHIHFSERLFEGEIPLIRALVSLNGQKTFLPQLRSLASPEVFGNLAILIPPSLTRLHLDIDAFASTTQSEDAFERLAGLTPMTGDPKELL